MAPPMTSMSEVIGRNWPLGAEVLSHSSCDLHLGKKFTLNKQLLQERDSTSFFPSSLKGPNIKELLSLHEIVDGMWKLTQSALTGPTTHLSEGHSPNW